jgi:MYXO-CTERM domain-containing protein
MLSQEADVAVGLVLVGALLLAAARRRRRTRTSARGEVDQDSGRSDRTADI